MNKDFYLYCKLDLVIENIHGIRSSFTKGKTYRIIEKTELGSIKVESDDDPAYFNDSDTKVLKAVFNLIEGDKIYGYTGV